MPSDACLHTVDLFSEVSVQELRGWKLGCGPGLRLDSASEYCMATRILGLGPQLHRGGKAALSFLKAVGAGTFKGKADLGELFSVCQGLEEATT